MKIEKVIVLALFAALLCISLIHSDKVNLYLFYKDGCPYCEKEKAFLSEIAPKYPDLKITMFEVFFNESNRELFRKAAEGFGVPNTGVPVTFIGNDSWIGYTDEYGKDMENTTIFCSNNACEDKAGKILNLASEEEPQENKTGKESNKEIANGTASKALNETKKNATLHIFTREGCPHCAEEKTFLNSILSKYPGLVVVEHEVFQGDNITLYKKIAGKYGIAATSVPATFIDDAYYIGYSESIGKEIEGKIKFCIENECPDPIENIDKCTNITNTTPGCNTLNVPFFGEIDPQMLSLPVMTIVIAGLDSMNPCAFFVLFFLLSMLVRGDSRLRMLLIGGTFVFFSALIYFLFMAAWLNVFLIAGEMKFITYAAGIIAIIIALLNIKEYFFFKKGPSLTISDDAKPDLIKKMRNLLKSDSIYTMMVAAVLLAVSANLYELLCTAGFPMVFTRILTLNNLDWASYYAYLILYNLIYVIPLSIIVLFFSFTMGEKRLSEDEGQILKLISGIMMLLLALVLIFLPDLMNNLAVSIWLLILSLLFSAAIVIIKKMIQYEKVQPKNSRQCKKTAKEPKAA